VFDKYAAPPLEEELTMRHFSVPLTLAFALGSAAQRACNNFVSLCNVSYDQVTHLGAHNSPYLRVASNRFSIFGNQFFDTAVQLDAGVRLLTVQVHASKHPVTKARQLRLCHTSCMFFDAGALQDWLFEIRTWLDRNPNEVLTLVLVNYHFVNTHEIAAEYAKADLAHYGW
jgi:hypothetical protein